MSTGASVPISGPALHNDEHEAIACPWPPGPREPRLAPGELHVWLADLAEVPAQVTASLSADERARANRVLNAHKGELCARSRGVLRELVGRYLDVEPGTLRFARNAGGKPRVCRQMGEAPFSFSVSHSGRLALYAFAEASVGVDVQLPPRRPRERGFLREWARREALLKCRAVHFGMLKPAPSDQDQPWVANLDIGAGADAAVAAAHRPRAVQCFRWVQA